MAGQEAKPQVSGVLPLLSRCTRCGATLRKGDTQRVSQRISTSVVLVADSSYCCPAREWGWDAGVRGEIAVRGPVLDGAR